MKTKKEMGRTGKVIVNTLAQLLPEVVSTVSGLVLPRLMLLTFGSALTGLVSSINQFLAYLRKMEAGLSTASAVNLYKPLATKDKQKIREVVSASRYFYWWVGILFSIGSFVLAAIYPFIVDVGVEGYTWYKVASLVLILAGSAAFSYFCSSAYQALLIADQRYYVVSINMTVYGIIVIPLVCLAIKTGNMHVVQLTHLAIAVIQAITLAIYTKRKYGEMVKPTKDFDKKALNMRWDVFINELGLLLETNAPVMILTFFIGLSSVSVYTVYNMVFVALQSIIRISRDALRPAFGQAWASGETETVKSCYSEFEWLIFVLVAVMYTIAGIMILPFVRLYTDGVTDINYILPLFSILFCISGAVRQIQIPASVMVGAAGKFKEVRYCIIISALSCVVIGVIAGMTLGISGVMFGMVCGTCIKTIYTTFFINKSVLNRGMKVTITRFIRMCMVSIISMLPFITLIHIQPQNYIEWFLCAGGVSVWVLLVAVCDSIIFDKKDMIMLSKRLLGVVKKTER